MTDPFNMNALESTKHSEDWRCTFRRRAWLVEGLLLIWVGILAVHFFSLMSGPSGHREREQAGTWRTYVLPAIRGRILDASGHPLAWSEREIDLVYVRNRAMNAVWKDMFAVQECIGMKADRLMRTIATSRTNMIVLKHRLTPTELCLLSKLSGYGVRYLPRHRFIRRYRYKDPRLRTWIGQTRQYGRRELGVTGIERLYNRELTGEEGQFRVLVDQYGKWVPGTWQQVKAPRGGFDKYVDFRLARAE